MARSKIDETFDSIDVLQYAIDELVIVRRSRQNCSEDLRAVWGRATRLSS
jgi:hypothetical protein